MGSSAARRVAILVSPIALAVLAAIHPGSATPDDLPTWMAIHVLQIPLAAGLGISVLLLVDGMPGLAATLTRAATLPWIAAFAAFDALAGLAEGIVVDVGADQADAAAALDEIRASLTGGILIDIVGWITIGGALVTGLALIATMRAAGRSVVGAGLVAVGALVWTVIHPLVGAPAMLAFALGSFLVERSRPDPDESPAEGESYQRPALTGSDDR